jgi:hypothetical protein
MQRACDSPFIDNPQLYPQLFVDIAESTTRCALATFGERVSSAVCCAAELAAARPFALQSAAKHPK